MAARQEKGPVTRFLARNPVGQWKGFVRYASALNVLLYKLSGGRVMGSLEGVPICLVTMRGRRSGALKTIPLMYVPHGDAVLLVASLGGAPKHPAWYHSVRANPEIEIRIGRQRRQLRAREASDEEHRALWPVAVAAYPSYADYQRKTERRIPILICR